MSSAINPAQNHHQTHVGDTIAIFAQSVVPRTSPPKTWRAAASAHVLKRPGFLPTAGAGSLLLRIVGDEELRNATSKPEINHPDE